MTSGAADFSGTVVSPPPPPPPPLNRSAARHVPLN